MKIRVLMKTPDALMMGLESAFATIESFESEDEVKHHIDKLYEKISKRWMQYGEYLTVEFDSESMTATVV